MAATAVVTKTGRAVREDGPQGGSGAGWVMSLAPLALGAATLVDTPFPLMPAVALLAATALLALLGMGALLLAARLASCRRELAAAGLAALAVAANCALLVGVDVVAHGLS